MKLLQSEIRKPYFLKLKKFLWDSGLKSAQNTPQTVKIYPPAKDIYNWSKTPLGKVKVVIIGQDPYHGHGQAHGLCFSVPHGVKVPPSLQNIYKELKTEYPDFTPPKHGNLEAWSTNGVLMLNTCLTVKASEAGSHSRKGWEQFTEKVVEVIDQYGGANLPAGASGSESTGVGRGIVFLAWGAWASERVSKLSKSKHLVLTSAVSGLFTFIVRLILFANSSLLSTSTRHHIRLTKGSSAMAISKKRMNGSRKNTAQMARWIGAA
ncbi:hypothetical protein H1R20_g14242, partial [Candolleomyces eurysporus]